MLDQDSSQEWARRRILNRTVGSMAHIALDFMISTASPFLPPLGSSNITETALVLIPNFAPQDKPANWQLSQKLVEVVTVTRGYLGV